MTDKNDQSKPVASDSPKPQAPPPERIHEPSIIMETRNDKHDVEIKIDKPKPGQ